MLKKAISTILIMLFLFVSFAGTFAQGHKKVKTNKHGNGEFIEENVTTQEYVKAVDGVEAKDEVIGYKVNYSVTPNQMAIDNNWTYDVKFNDTEVAENIDSEPFENDIPSCYVEATRTNPSYAMHKTESSLVEGDNTIILDKATNEANNGFNGAASFEIKVTVTKVTISEAIEAVVAVDEQLKIVETYVTGYKFTSGKWAGYSINFAEKILKCKTYIRVVDDKEEIVKVENTKEWYKLKCLEFGIYVKKTCKWDKGYLFKYKCWKHNGVYVNVENEQVIKINLDADKGNQYQGSSESNSSSSSSSSSNEEYYSSSSSSGSSDDTNSSADDDKTVYSDSLPKTGESVPVYGMIVGGLLLLIGTIILLRKKIVNKIMR